MIKILVSDVLNFLNEIAPFDSACDFDNVGLLVGSLGCEVKKVLIALDLNRTVLNEAKKLNVNLIVTHHPLIFKPVKKIKASSLLFDVVSSKISVICVHTNLDVAKQGVSFSLAQTLEMCDVEILPSSENFGRVGFLKQSLTCAQFLEFVCRKLNTIVKATKVESLIKKVAVVSGAGGSFLQAAVDSKADAFVTGECKHSDFVEACNENLCLIEAGHFETENLICEVLKRKLKTKFLNLDVVLAKNCKSAHYFIGESKWL